MRLFDITAEVRPGMPVCPGDPEVVLEAVSRVSDGGGANVSRLGLGTHTGTHIDPPSHLFGGGPSADKVGLEVLVGPALVVDAGGLRAMDGEFIAKSVPKGAARVLFKTREGGTHGGCFLTPDAALRLVELGVRLAGTDEGSVDPADGEGLPAHHILLGGGAVILEGLALDGITPGEYELICLPLKIKDGDGAPARVLLRDIR